MERLELKNIIKTITKNSVEKRNSRIEGTLEETVNFKIR